MAFTNKEMNPSRTFVFLLSVLSIHSQYNVDWLTTRVIKVPKIDFMCAHVHLLVVYWRAGVHLNIVNVVIHTAGRLSVAVVSFQLSNKCCFSASETCYNIICTETLKDFKSLVFLYSFTRWSGWPASLSRLSTHPQAFTAYLIARELCYLMRSFKWTIMTYVHLKITHRKFHTD